MPHNRVIGDAMFQVQEATNELLTLQQRIIKARAIEQDKTLAALRAKP